jgi:putative oxidoreductase
MCSQADVPTTKKPGGWAGMAYYRFQRASAGLETPFLLLVRLYWGWQFAETGWGKLAHLSHVTQFFGSLGIPAAGPTALFVSLLEFVGGLALIAGLGTRVTGFLLAGDMVVAYYLADRAALDAFITHPGRFYGADPFTFLFASLIVLIFGAGRISLDYWFFRRKRR